MFGKLGTLVVSLLLATGLALSADNKGDWEFGVFTGYALLGGYDGSRSELRDRRISDDDLNLDDDFLFGARVGYFLTPNWSLEASYQHLSTEAKFDRCEGRPCPGTPQETANPDADLDSLRFNLLYNWRRDTKIVPFFTVGVGLEGTDIESVMDDHDLGYNAGMGVRFALGSGFSVRVEGHYVLTDVSSPVDDFQASFQGSAGLSWTFGGKPPVDTDGDGINDGMDRCPQTPGGAIVDERGCPLDGDGDGVPDGLDACPDTPRDVVVDTTGCA